MIVRAARAAPAADDWLAANQACNALGFAWLDKRLAAEPATADRAAWHAARAAMQRPGALDTTQPPSALDRISALFNLSAFDEDVLLITLAAAHDGSFGPRFGAAQGRSAAAPATPHLLALLLFDSHSLPPAALQRLTRSAPLHRFALIETGASDFPITAPLVLPSRLHQALSGLDSGLDFGHESSLCHLEPIPLPPRLEAQATRLAAKNYGGDAQFLRLQIIGPRGSGRAALAAALLQRLDLVALHAPEAMPAMLAASAARDARLGGCGLIIDMDYTSIEAARRLDSLPVPLILIAESAIADVPHIPISRLTPMTPSERAALFRVALPTLTAPEIVAAAEQFRLGPTALHAIVRQPGIAETGLWAACRDRGGRDLETLTTRIVPERGWDDIILADQTRADLMALVALIQQRPLVQGDWGYRAILGRATGITTLFAGPSGTGKSMAAEVVADALHLDLNIVDLSQVTSKFIGETEKNLRRIFDAAEGGGAVLFFDEADALFGKRSEVKDSHDRYANAEVSYLLQRMESYSGLAILATNLKSHLDTAFLRRLRMIVDFPLPDVAARHALWRRALPPTAPQMDIDWPQLARLELSGGNITTIAANAAGAAAATDDGVITMVHLQAAIAAEYRKLDRDASGLG